MAYQRYAIGGAGAAVRLLITSSADDAAANVRSGEVCLPAPALPGDPIFISADGSSLCQGAVPLAQAQADRWAAAKGYRADRMAAGCATPLGRVQTDANSRDAITQSAADAVARQVAVPAWSIEWVMADNSVKTHTAAQMIAMASAVRTYIAGCQTASQVVRKVIFAANTVAAVAAVDITAGYPA